jgi:lipid-A-disaccharide synthase
MRILISVGDDSGDLHAANFMRAARCIAPDVEFSGVGMARMADAGLEPLQADDDDGSAMWFHNLLRVGKLRRRLRLFTECLDRNGADLVVPVDYGGFNLYLCRAATRRRVPVFYYIPPQVWAHGRYRLKKLRKWVTQAGVIYSFEKPHYDAYGAPAEYVGHPLFDELAAHPPRPDVVASLKERFGPQLVALFPGSRLHEVRAHLPIVAGACKSLRRAAPDVAFAAVSTARMAPHLAGPLSAADPPIELLTDVTPAELASAAALAITKSGTVTLEIAAQGTPMVVFYRVGRFGQFLFHGYTSTPHVGLVNNLAGRMICPERLVSGAPSDIRWLAAEAERLLCDEQAAEQCRSDIRDALEGFAEPGASERAARSALGLVALA